jgi:hypothetical protein
MGYDDPNRVINHRLRINAFVMQDITPSIIKACIVTAILGITIGLSIGRWKGLSYRPVVCYAGNIVDAYPHAIQHEIYYFIPRKLENPQSFIACMVHTCHTMFGLIAFIIDEVIIETHYAFHCLPQFIIDKFY